MEKHPSHIENIPRLNRIAGQIEGIKKMIEDGRYCPEIISQLRAVRAAVKAVESNILKGIYNGISTNPWSYRQNHLWKRDFSC